MDTVSKLPQPIIEIILCFLPIREAARTSILSREWRYKWTTIPKLAFEGNIVYKWRTSKRNQQSDLEQTSCLANARKNMDWRCKLFYAIHQVLLLRQGPIHEFILSCYPRVPIGDCFEIDQIIFHLSRNHIVKKLTLSLPSYSLPLCVFSLHHLKDLCLEYCYIDHKPIFNGFGSLTTLTLKCVGISGKSLLHLLSNCPSLNRLCLQMHGGSLIGNDTPNIMELLKCLPLIEHLTIVQDMVMASVPQELSTSLSHLKYVCIHGMICCDANGLVFLALLVKCSPNLEKIKVKFGTVCCEECGTGMLEKYSIALENVLLEHLNELEIGDFRVSKSEMKLLKFILARSPNLKKVMLRTHMLEKAKELEMLKVMLGIQRESPVEIIIEYLSLFDIS